MKSAPKILTLLLAALAVAGAPSCSQSTLAGNGGTSKAKSPEDDGKRPGDTSEGLSGYLTDAKKISISLKGRPARIHITGLAGAVTADDLTKTHVSMWYVFESDLQIAVKGKSTICVDGQPLGEVKVDAEDGSFSGQVDASTATKAGRYVLSTFGDFDNGAVCVTTGSNDQYSAMSWVPGTANPSPLVLGGSLAGGDGAGDDGGITTDGATGTETSSVTSTTTSTTTSTSTATVTFAGSGINFNIVSPDRNIHMPAGSDVPVHIKIVPAIPNATPLVRIGFSPVGTFQVPLTEIGPSEWQGTLTLNTQAATMQQWVLQFLLSDDNTGVARIVNQSVVFSDPVAQ